jgi:hypothetical protein
MQVDQHDKISQWLHDFYLGNRSVAELSFDLECMLAGKTAPVDQAVLVTGLARSGTTSVFNHIYNSGEHASLLYSDMPFLLMPNLWGKHQRPADNTKTERFHGDNILVGADSPEALVEFSWKTFLKDSYITKDYLKIHDLDPKHLSKYEKYMSLICKARGKSRYVSKNNNNILRIKGLLKLNTPKKIIMLYRHPIDHAGSLMKLHVKFSKQQTEDPFVLRYFNYLGHHEFGLNQKPFYLDPGVYQQMAYQDKSNFDFWLLSWFNYYSHVVKHHLNDVMLVSFKDVCEQPLKVYPFINEQLGISQTLQYPEPYTPPTYEAPNLYSATLLQECMVVYEQLNTARKYC